jgi:lipopolysaccharide assembly protein A
MKGQWTLILAFIFALVIAAFAVINVEPVEVDYLFGTAMWPLILIILGSVLMGGFIVASVGLLRMITLQRQVKKLERENTLLRDQVPKEQQTEVVEKEEQESESEKN